MIDTHIHLQDKQYDTDRDTLINKSFASGLTKIFVIGTDVSESKKAVALAEKYDQMYSIAGIQPDEFKYGTEQDIVQIEKLLTHPKVIGVGEIGLDYFMRGDDVLTAKQIQAQKQGFIDQIQLAKKYNLPIIVHCREAYADCLDIFVQENLLESEISVIMHCYQGDTEFTAKLLPYENVYFSFAGNCTYPVKKVLRETKDDVNLVMQSIPLTKILTETDGPYLSPQAHRGHRNEPPYVQHILGKIAEVKNVAYKEIEEKVSQTVDKIFTFEK